MDTEQIRNRLIKLHEEENDMNKQMGKINHSIRELEKKKAKIRKMISHNMLFRNKLINQL